MGTNFQDNIFETESGNIHYDAIVIGSGISGGWAAKELCEKGLKTLLLERGRNVDHIRDYPTAGNNPWDFKYRNTKPRQDSMEDPIQSSAYEEANKHFFVRDADHPYIQEKPFMWIRGYQVGGRSLTWGRQCYRLSDMDFEANQKDGIGVDWPIRYKDIAPWYDYVETFVGISGRPEGLPQLPDGCFLPPMEFNSIEEHFKRQVENTYPERKVTIARLANLTRGWKDRGPCLYRNACSRGCPFSGYFSSNSATLPAAQKTGNLTMLPDSIVVEILYDKEIKKATGVRVLNTHTNLVTNYFSKIIFLNASTIATTQILLNSVSDAFPEGMGNSSGQLGHNLMDHHFRVGAEGEHDGFKDRYYKGRRPGGIYIPRFRNLTNAIQKDYLRGFGVQGDGERSTWMDNVKRLPGFGADFKDKLTRPGPWTMWLGAWGETLPYFTNCVKLDKNKQDQWGLPLVKINFEYGENEFKMRKDMLETTADMLDTAGFKNIQSFDYKPIGGACVHEMGTARMGHDPKTSVLNKWNQLHDVPNVFVTDGSCMTSSASQNPSLTYMALTARACDFAVMELKKGNL